MCLLCGHHIYLKDLIENIQHNFTKRIPGLYYMNFVKGFFLELNSYRSTYRQSNDSQFCIKFCIAICTREYE